MRTRFFLPGSAAAILAALMLANPALAYVGPGAGITVLGALWGLIVGVVLAVGVILFWPVRLLIRKLRNKPADTEQTAAAQATDHGSDSSKPAA